MVCKVLIHVFMGGRQPKDEPVEIWNALLFLGVRSFKVPIWRWNPHLLWVWNEKESRDRS